MLSIGCSCLCEGHGIDLWLCLWEGHSTDGWMSLGGGHTADFCLCRCERSTVLATGHTSSPTHCGQSQWAKMFRPRSGFISVASSGSMANLFVGVLALDPSL